MDGELIWTQVSAYWVASWSVPIKSSKKRPHVEGYEDVPKSDLPAEIFQVIDTHEWTNFAQISSEPGIFIAGSNMATRLRIAKAIKETSGHAHNRGGQGSGNQGSGNHRPSTDANQDSGSQASNPSEGRRSQQEARHSEPVSQSEDPGQAKDGGVNAFFDSGTLYVEAARYDKKGADPEAILEQIFKVVDAAECEGFLAVVRLQGLWWSEGTYETKHDSSDRCLQVLKGLFNMGCRGLTGDLDLSMNDLDDWFLERFLRLVEDSDSSLDSMNLDENRITTNGATKLLDGIQARARRSFGLQLRRLQLMNNPVDNCQEVEAAADAAGLRCCKVGPPWTREEAARALLKKSSWSTYFYGPIQLLRSKMLDMPRQLTMVECPICNCVLKHDLGLKYTVTGNLASHLCGDKHRKKILDFLQDHKVMCNILIVSPVWSFTLHPLTGELKWVEKREDLHVMPQPDRDSYQVDVRREATSVRAFLWPEGRESVAKQVNPEMAYDILEHRHKLEKNQLWPDPTDSANRKLNVRDIEFTQASIAPRFRNGGYLTKLISDLNEGNLDPCRTDWLQLEVVQFRDKFYSNDNRRLFCLKQHQRHVDWNVKVMTRVYSIPKVLERFVERYFERWKLIGDKDPDYIRVRGPRVQSTPPWRR